MLSQIFQDQMVELVKIQGVFEKWRDCARCTNNCYSREKSIASYDVTMSPGFENQISAFCDNYILFYTFFCQGTFYVTVLWKFDKIKNFWLFFL